MKYWNEYIGHNAIIEGKIKQIDTTIYTFDIETTSYIIYNNQIHSAIEYDKLDEETKENCEYGANMYIWTFGINNVMYYGRTWEEFNKFLNRLEMYSNYAKKIVFVHNLAFEFHFLSGFFNFEEVIARKAHKVMQCKFVDYNIYLQCTYFMSNVALKLLPKIYNLDTQKLIGDLDYSLLRHSRTQLSSQELKYCENDCLVLYKYILLELETYKRIDKIPLTSTGHVRRELRAVTVTDYNYRNKVNKAINIDTHVYNLLQEAFAGGYTHANYIYTDIIIENVDSFDFTSSYPYVMVTNKYPSTEFKKCNIKSLNQMSKRFAYLLKVKFYNIKCKYYNNFISYNKCRNIRGGRYDNGRIIQANELEITLTDIDFYFILSSYNIEKYEILDSYYSLYDYLPQQFLEFILEKYVNKTQYKNVEGKEIEYQKEKNKFNSLYGMSVTNTIRDKVLYDNVEGWKEEELTNSEIIDALCQEKKKSFLSFAYGVWVTAHARYNLLNNLVKLDEYVIYSDTDSLKLKQGYNKEIIENYNQSVIEKIKKVSNLLEIDINKYQPCDKFRKSSYARAF